MYVRLRFTITFTHISQVNLNIFIDYGEYFINITILLSKTIKFLKISILNKFNIYLIIISLTQCRKALIMKSSTLFVQGRLVLRTATGNQSIK